MEVRIQTRQKIVFLEQGNEMQPELQRGRLDTDPRINDTTRNTQCDGYVRVLDVLDVARQHAGYQRMHLHQVVQQHAGARSRLAIHKSQPFADQIGKTAHYRRMFPANHQSLHSPGAGNEFVQLWLKQRLQRAGKDGGRSAKNRHMEPGHQAFVVIQCPKGMDAALKTDIQIEISLVGDMLLEDRESDVMTGANRQ